MNQDTGELTATFLDLITAVNYWRGEKFRLDREVEELERTHAALYQARAEAKRFLEEADEQLRRETVNAYLDHGNHHPWPGCSVKLIRRPHYEYDVARDWALHRAPHLLKLDEVAFKKQAPGIEGAPIKFDLVPVAVIVSNLAAHIDATERHREEPGSGAEGTAAA